MQVNSMLSPVSVQQALQSYRTARTRPGSPFEFGQLLVQAIESLVEVEPASPAQAASFPSSATLPPLPAAGTEPAAVLSAPSRIYTNGISITIAGETWPSGTSRTKLPAPAPAPRPGSYTEAGPLLVGSILDQYF